MKKALCVFAALAIVAVASADINLWLSETGITDPGQAFIKTTQDFMPVFDTTGGAPIVAPYDMGICCEQPEKTFFVWGEFTYGSEVWYEKLYGLHIFAETTGCMTLEDSVVYRHQGKNSKGAVQWTRWDGDLDLVMDGCEDLPVPAAVTANGIRYDYGINGGSPGNYDMRIYDPVSYNTRFLLGAIKVKCNCTADDGGELYVGLGTLGIITDGAVTGGTVFPDVYYHGVLMQSGGAPPSACQSTMVAFCTPEPASILLIGLAGLFLRRR